MSYEEVMQMMEETGFIFAYHHFAEGQSPEPPFLVYLYPQSNNFSADGTVYFKARALNVELYTDLKSPELEEKVENVLEAHGIYWEKSEVYIETEKLYEVLYEMEV